MATTPNDPHRTTVTTDPAYVDPARTPGAVDPTVRDPAYREPVVHEDNSSGGMGKWVMIALAALAVALLLSFFVGSDNDVEEASTTVIEGDGVAVVETEAPAVEADPNVEVVETDEPIIENGETVPLGEATDTAAAPVVETEAPATETAETPVIEENATEATDTAATPLTEENPGTDPTETGAIEVQPVEAEAPAEGEIEFREVEVQSTN